MTYSGRESIGQRLIPDRNRPRSVSCRRLHAGCASLWLLLGCLLEAAALAGEPHGSPRTPAADLPALSSPSQTPRGLEASHLTPRDTEPLYTPIRYALVIGVNHTKEKALPPLKYAVRDAEQMADSLRHPDVGGFEQVVLLRDPDLKSVERALEEAQATLRPNDVFLMYFSGHGSAAIDGRLRSTLYLLTRDTTLATQQDSGMSVRAIQERLTAMKPRRKVLIVDACYNGEGKSALSPQSRAMRTQMKGLGEVDLVEPLRESEAHLFAAAVGQPALEDQSLEGGVYTHFFLHALRNPAEADLNRDGAVSVAEAHSFGRDQTMARTGNRQVPWASYRIVGREDIFLAGNRRSSAERALLYTFDSRFQGARLLINGEPRGVLPRPVEVEAGTQLVSLQAPDGTPLFSEYLRLENDDSVRLEDLELGVSTAKKRWQTLQRGTLVFTGALSAATAVAAFRTLSLYQAYQTLEPEDAATVDTLSGQFYRSRLATNLFLGSSMASGAITAWLFLTPPRMILRASDFRVTVGVYSRHAGGEIQVSGDF